VRLYLRPRRTFVADARQRHRRDGRKRSTAGPRHHPTGRDPSPRRTGPTGPHVTTPRRTTNNRRRTPGARSSHRGVTGRSAELLAEGRCRVHRGRDTVVLPHLPLHRVARPHP
jgi:hypothetical protein